MKVAVRFFARYREAAGRDSLDLELPDGGTVERAWEAVPSWHWNKATVDDISPMSYPMVSE